MRHRRRRMGLRPFVGDKVVIREYSFVSHDPGCELPWIAFIKI